MENKLQRADAGGKPAYNTYYMRVSAWYRIGKWLLLLFFTVYLTVMMLSHRESITYENLLYLLRDFNVTSSVEGGFSSISYDEQPNMTFASYKGELVAAGSTEILFFDGKGGVVLRDSSACETPVLASGDKYLLVYDEGGTTFALYTAVACVMRGETDSSIQSGAMSDTGAFAIATRSQDTKYLVTLYSSSYRKIASYYRDAYVTDITLSSDGERLAILEIADRNGVLDGVVTLCRSNSSETQEIVLSNQIPLAASYLKDGTLSVVTDSAVHFYDSSGQVKNVFTFSSMTLSWMSFSDTRVAVVCNEDILGTSSRVAVLDSNGNVSADTVLHEKIHSVTASDGQYAAYVQGQNSILYLAQTGAESLAASCAGNLLHICEISALPVFCFPTVARAADT